METGFVPPMANGGAMPPGMPMPGMMQPQWQPQPMPKPPQRPRYKRPDWMTDEYLTTKFSAWSTELTSHWGEWQTDARQCYDVTAGRQWDKEAFDDAIEKEITPVSINKVDSTVSAICGSEMTNRHEVRYYPRETSTKGPDGQRSDIVVNEILTAAAEWTRDECDAADEESEAFRDCIICGIGVTETRMDYEMDTEGVAIVSRVDPLEMGIGCALRPNAVDARYIRRVRGFSKDEAREKFNITEGNQRPTGSSEKVHSNNAGEAYTHGTGEGGKKSEVWVTEWQWFEMEKVYKVVDPSTNELIELNEEQFQKAMSFLPDLDSASHKVRRYYRAFQAGDQIIECTPLPDEEFTYKFITGKWDRNRSVWYGVVKALVDPQRLLNKQVSQIQRIIDTNAKGGLLAESNVFEDLEQAKEDWAASDTIVEVAEGALKEGRVIPKPMSSYPAGIDKLLMVAMEAVPGTSGVNNEMLGLIDREQAGVVDVQRKEAAYGVLKAFFNALRRYRKLHGRHLLKLIQRYMTDGRLIRIIGRQGNVQYLPLARQPDTARYDCIVDEAPTGPNQKDKVFQYLTMLGPMLARMNLPPQVMMKFLEFSPLPSALVSEIMQEFQKIPPQPNPEEEKAKGVAAKAQADMQRLQVETQIEQQRLQLEAQQASMRMQADMQKMQAENQKLMVENEWVKLEMQKVAMQQRSDAEEAAIRARETAMREQNDTAKINADIEKMQLETAIKREELAIKREELNLKKMDLELRGRELDVTVSMDAAKMKQESDHRILDREAKERESQMSASAGATPKQASDRTSDAVGKGLEATGKGLEALAQVIGRPKTLIRPDGSKSRIE